MSGEVLPTDRGGKIPLQVGAVLLGAETANPDPVHTLIINGFAETAKSEYLGRSISGVHTPSFRENLEPIAQLMRDLHPRLDMKFLTANTYYTPDMHKSMVGMELGIGYGILPASLKYLRACRIEILNNLAEHILIPAQKEHVIEPGLLKKPPYFHQGDDSRRQGSDIAQGCASTCFRMVCSDIVGQKIPHDRVVDGIRTHFGDHKIDNYRYLNFFHSKALANSSQKRIVTYDLIGGDLSTVAAIAAKARQKWHGSEVYCTVALGTENGIDPSIMHQAVLLEADKDTVTYHDPSILRGADSLVASKETFVRRWSVGLNQAMIVITRPASSNS